MQHSIECGACLILLPQPISVVQVCYLALYDISTAVQNLKTAQGCYDRNCLFGIKNGWELVSYCAIAMCN